MKRHSRRDTYTPEIAAQICRRIADGESLRHICGEDRAKGIPERITVYNWMHRYPEFMRTYLLARRAQSDLYMDEAIEIADGRDPEGGQDRDVRRDKLRVDTRRWMIILMAPRLLSEQIALLSEIAPREDGMDDVDLAAKIDAIFESARRRLEAEREASETSAAQSRPT